MELVSVVIPVYNVENYLEECLDSVINQSYENLEILLIDDGSTDRSGAICDAYAEKDQRIKVCHLKNGGVSAARNYGIEKAEGAYLLFVDSDDCIHPDLIRILMEQTDNKIRFCDFVYDKEKLDFPDYEELPGEFFARADFMKVFSENYINSPVNKIFRTDILKTYDIRFPVEKNLGEDLLFNLEYLRYDKRDYLAIHLPLYYYRTNREGSLSSFYRPGLFELQQELFEAVRIFLEEQELWSEENQKRFWALYWDRLFLTVQMCRDYEKGRAGDSELPRMLRHPIWRKVRLECQKCGMMNWKRKVKRLILWGYRLRG